MSYKVCCVPETPSESLNGWLESRYSDATDSIFQFITGSAMCGFYHVASLLNRALLRARADFDPKQVWMGSCGVVGVAVGAAAWFIFNVLIVSSVIIHGVLYYAAVLIALGGLGMGAAGAFYFGIQGASAKRGGGDGDVASSEFQSSYRSTVTTSTEYTRSHDD